jgi:hypothetical protein
MKLPVPQECALAQPKTIVLSWLLMLFAASSVFGQEPSQKQIADRFVTDRLAVWQQRLHLEDWHITVAIARKAELKPRTLGGTRWDKHKKSATIWVLDPADYSLPFTDVLNDLELTLVHELVHLELASLPRSEASRSPEEHAVNRLSEALLALDKQQK